jgi:LPXTG-site transpeptidase (sortase) family protein
VLIVGILLVGVGLNAVRNWYIIQHAGVPAGHIVATESTDAPSEQPVPDSYSVPEDKPLSIQLPTIMAEGFIQQVGVDKDNQMVVPSNVNMAGWYTKGSLPGDAGISIIDGHVHGLYAKGIFYNLGKLKTNETFTVTYGDKSVRKFKVKKVQTVSTKEADTALFVRYKTIPKQLNLITCTGRFDKDSKTFDSRVIVVAEAY